MKKQKLWNKSFSIQASINLNTNFFLTIKVIQDKITLLNDAVSPWNKEVRLLVKNIGNSKIVLIFLF